jgi:2-hydroxy-3-keto-5-methylthiopentenyl-1-phosphate phosphatase
MREARDADMPTAWLCDFDGTVSPLDIGEAFVARFSAGEAARVPELAAWRAGKLSTRELARAQCAHVRAREPESLAFARGYRLDPTFAPFVRDALARGDEVAVVSEGYDFYLRELLARESLGDLPWSANRLVFAADGSVTPEFPFADPACATCGNCKARHVREYRARGFRTVLVGDGDSDRHGALAADFVLARGRLRTWCAAEGVAHEPFTSFADAARHPQAGPRLAAPAAPVKRVAS